MSSALGLILLAAVAAVASGMVVVKREVPIHEDSYHHGLNSVDDFHHFSNFKLPLPPAYSTISFLQSHHSKPVSYSGFTNHGHGHHDPGYAVEYRSEGMLPPPHGPHHHHHYY